MEIEIILQYASIVIALFILFLKRKGMKRYVPVGLFAIIYADTWCYISKYFNLWEFPLRIFAKIEDISVPVNMIVVPIVAMVWVRYCPRRLREILLWGFIWATGLVVIEYVLEEFTDIIEYKSWYDWYHSYILWFISFYVWLLFHLWLNNWQREIESLFRRPSSRK